MDRGAHRPTTASRRWRTLEVVASRIFSAADILEDETYAELGDIITVDDDDLGPVRMQGVIPASPTTRDGCGAPGPGLGEDNELVYKKFLGMDDDRYERFGTEGVIS